MRIRATRTGTYRGQCAEVCGKQHANMAIVVVVDDSATFERWVSRQLADASPPTDSVGLEGQRRFVSGPCAFCHTVRGTPALADAAPDLTHLASRGTIAAGTLTNTPGNLEAWIANAQSLKPGAMMPTITQCDGRQLRAIAAYLGELK